MSSDPGLESEVQRLRNQIPELMKRVEQAEEARKRAEAAAGVVGRTRAPSNGGETSNGNGADDVSPGVAAWR